VLVGAACTGGDDDAADGGLADPGDCVVVDVATSPEKFSLLTDLASSFNDSDGADLGDGKCAFVRVQTVSSGRGASLLAEDWPQNAGNGPRPVVWSPAASTWAGVVEQRRADEGLGPIIGEFQPFMLTPLVIAMPRPMAQALGWPGKALGFADVLALSQDARGWAAFGHPEWGPFRLGKTNPNFSTSGLSALIGQYYAATGKTSDLTLEDLARPEVREAASGVESSVVHYGDTTLTFLNNWFRNDTRGTALTYVSAAAVEEKSVIDYNRGDPDGILDPGEEPRKPRVPLVAIYPREGTVFSDNPFIVLDAPWVSSDQREAANRFDEYVRRPANQERVLEFGFRPGNPRVAIGPPIVSGNGVDPSQPQTTLDVPEPEVLVGLIDQWALNRKRARVLLTIDVSGSMGEPGNPATDESKLDLAKQAAVTALDEFEPDDEVGLRIFSTDLGPDSNQTYLDLVPIGPLGENREQIASSIRNLIPTQGTPLYRVAQASYSQMQDEFDPTRINAVLLLTDGRNEDPGSNDLNSLLRDLNSRNEGSSSRPVRIFTIAYGDDADQGTLERIAEATNGAAYTATDPTTIDRVFIAVVSNF
jgi:Ca-activated chloride channel family protein